MRSRPRACSPRLPIRAGFPRRSTRSRCIRGQRWRCKPLNWGDPLGIALAGGEARPLVLLLDRVTDPHNVGAVLRSAEVFGARALIAPHRYSAPETGALAKAASGALERQPYFRVKNLATTMEQFRSAGFQLFGLDGDAPRSLDAGFAEISADQPVGLVLGAEGPGLREKTKSTCDHLVRIPAAGGFGSLNVSNAAAVALYACRRAEG